MILRLNLASLLCLLFCFHQGRLQPNVVIRYPHFPIRTPNHALPWNGKEKVVLLSVPILPSVTYYAHIYCIHRLYLCSEYLYAPFLLSVSAFSFCFVFAKWCCAIKLYHITFLSCLITNLLKCGCTLFTEWEGSVLHVLSSSTINKMT